MQPTVRVDNNEILYEEIQANGDASNFIHCYWQLKTKKTLKIPFSYSVVSDGCIDIFFEINSPEKSFVMGFCRKYIEFEIGNSFHYIGMRFLPSAFPILFNISAQQLSNTSQELINILPDLSHWFAENVVGNLSIKNLAELFNQYFEALIFGQTFDLDFRFYHSLIKIFENRGNLDVQQDLNTGLSPRQLRRIFNFYIGTTPKAFSNVVRFQYILNAKPSTQSLKENKLYFDVGFFDQAHFIKNFKTFYGVTPSEAFS